MRRGSPHEHRPLHNGPPRGGPFFNARGRKPVVALAWFTGARLDILRRCPSDVGFYNALGLAVVLLGIASGVSVSVALGNVVDSNPRSLWWASAVWALFIMNVERLILGMPTGRRRLLVTSTTVLARAAATFFIALIMAEPLAHAIFDTEIRAQLQQEARAATHATVEKTRSFYAPRIEAAQREVDQIRREQRDLRMKRDRYRFLAECEKGEVACSTTRRLGCGPFCRRYARLSDTAAAELQGRAPRDRQRLRDLEQTISRLNEQAQVEEREGRTAIRERTGVIARAEALSAVQKKHTVASTWVWFIRIGLIVFDLLPLAVKTVRSFVVHSPYEDLLAVAAEKESLAAHEERLRIRFERDAVARRARMADEVDRVSVDLETDHRIAEEEDRWAAPSHTRASGSPRRPVPGISLSEYVDDMAKHENKPVDVAPGLSRGAWIAMGVTAVVVAISVLFAFEFQAIRGLWLAPTALLVLGSLAVYTRGFRKAPAWAMHVIFISILTALALPVLIVVINV